MARTGLQPADYTMLEYLRLLPGGSGSSGPGGFNITPVGIGVVIAVLFVVFLVLRRK